MGSVSLSVRKSAGPLVYKSVCVCTCELVSLIANKPACMQACGFISLHACDSTYLCVCVPASLIAYNSFSLQFCVLAILRACLPTYVYVLYCECLCTNYSSCTQVYVSVCLLVFTIASLCFCVFAYLLVF